MTTFDSTSTYDAALGYGGGFAIPHSWIELEGIVFSGAPDDEGVEWYISTFEGWDSPELRSSSTPRPFADGVFVPGFFHGRRMLSLDGTLVAPDLASAFAAKERLAAAMNLVRTEGLLVVHEDRSRQVAVRRGAPPKFTQRRQRVDFSIVLLAPDHRKHDVVETAVFVAADVDGIASHEGNVEPILYASITGPVEMPVLVNATTGEELAFDLTLEATETLDLDFDLRTATIAGVSVRSLLLPGYRWWSLRPYSETVFRLEGDAFDVGAAVDLRYRHAWI